MSDELRESLPPASAGSAYLGAGRPLIESSITPSIVHNTVDNPFAPRSGMRLTGQLSVRRRRARRHEPTSSGPRSRRSSTSRSRAARRSACACNAGWIWNYGRTRSCPTTCATSSAAKRRFAASTSAPSVRSNENRPRRRHQVRAVQRRVLLRRPAAGPRARCSTTPARPSPRPRPIDLRQLRTSSGVELRVTLPVINVPFRLIYAWNIYRDSFQPARALQVRGRHDLLNRRARSARHPFIEVTVRGAEMNRVLMLILLARRSPLARGLPVAHRPRRCARRRRLPRDVGHAEPGHRRRLDRRPDLSRRPRQQPARRDPGLRLALGLHRRRSRSTARPTTTTGLEFPVDLTSRHRRGQAGLGRHRHAADNRRNRVFESADLAGQRQPVRERQHRRCTWASRSGTTCPACARKPSRR